MTEYLLDTNVLYRLRMESKRISSTVRALLEDTDNAIFYSVIAPWELTIKEAKGKLPVAPEFYSDLTQLGFTLLLIDDHHVQTLRTLPLIHHDPFDRMLVAQAKAEKMTLVTSDKRLAQYPIKTLLCDP